MFDPMEPSNIFFEGIRSYFSVNSTVLAQLQYSFTLMQAAIDLNLV